jgi:hypothetical protein
MFKDTLNLTEKISIISQSDLIDVIILDNNYLHLIHDAVDSEEKNQFVVLHVTTQKRIQELST